MRSPDNMLLIETRGGHVPINIANKYIRRQSHTTQEYSILCVDNEIAEQTTRTIEGLLRVCGKSVRVTWERDWVLRDIEDPNSKCETEYVGITITKVPK
jgi:hypothetical protein